LKKKNNSLSEEEILRFKAEKELIKNPIKIGPLSVENDMTKLFHELQVHQIELKLQNEELIMAKAAADEIAEKYIALYDFAPIGYYTVSKEGRIIQLNVIGANILNSERRNLVGKKFEQFVTNDTKQIFNFFLKKVFETGIRETCEVNLQILNGETPDVHIAFSVAEKGDECRLTVLDTSERKKAERELIESERNYRNLINSGKFLIWAAGIDRLCYFFNQGWLDFTGRSLAQEIGNGWTKGVHPDDLERCFEIYSSAFDKREKFSMEYRMRRYDGEYLWIVDDGSPSFNSKEEFTGYLGQCYVIDERKQAELVINQQNEHLKKPNSDKDRFMSILAHDLKSPFNGLLGLSGILLEKLHTYNISQIENIVNHINKTAKTTYSLMEELLMWIQSQSGKLAFEPKEVNIRAVCEEMVAVFQPVANEKEISIMFFESDEIVVYADLEMLKTILRNLVTNAIKFSNRKGEIKIYAEHKEAIISISVSDKGVGISEEDVSKLFDITVLHSNPGTALEKGTGLGLLLCKEFAEKHGGKIWVKSVLGKGSTFTFTLPAC
jgi:two-component system CheB/CheR fusion protein